MKCYSFGSRRIVFELINTRVGCQLFVSCPAPAFTLYIQEHVISGVSIVVKQSNGNHIR